jgi:hypothetical protein
MICWSKDVAKKNTAGASAGQKDSVLLILLAGFLVLIPLVAFLLWYFPSVGLVNIHPSLPWISALLIGGIAFFLFAGAGLLLLTLLTGRDLFLSDAIRRIVIKYFFPAVLGLGRLFHLNTERLQYAFISLNNQLVEAMEIRVPAEKILVLLPHCLQLSDCPVKITEDVHRCRRCGKCDIMELLDLYDEKGVRMAVVTGGTLARKMLKENRPDLIVAVACERDLVSGICDAWPLPVLGLLNERPYGPCLNTCVRVGAVRELVEKHIRA